MAPFERATTEPIFGSRPGPGLSTMKSGRLSSGRPARRASSTYTAVSPMPSVGASSSAKATT
jgi:hypothetical protein